jgi:hypothetical protein
MDSILRHAIWLIKSGSWPQEASYRSVTVELIRPETQSDTGCPPPDAEARDVQISYHSRGTVALSRGERGTGDHCEEHRKIFEFF